MQQQTQIVKLLRHYLASGCTRPRVSSSVIL